MSGSIARRCKKQPRCCRPSLTPRGWLTAGMKRAASSLVHHPHRRNSATGRQGGSGSRSHTPSGSMTERRTVSAGGAGGNSSFIAPDTSALRSSMTAGEAGGSPKKRVLRRVRRCQCNPPWSSTCLRSSNVTHVFIAGRAEQSLRVHRWLQPSLSSIVPSTV